jgi:hypothetical protein
MAMTDFIRQTSQKWHDEVPGSRWFKADLHIHTLDDHPNPSLVCPAGVTDPVNEQHIETYARAVLKSAAQRGVEVLGLTPHAPCAGTEDRTSVVWHIVHMWNTGSDDDGVLFRDKIYAVFPGLEPNFRDGSNGLHLLLLFDPEIGPSIPTASGLGPP